MDDVALDLDALDLGQAAAPHLQRRDLLGLEVRPQLAVGRHVDEARDLDQPLEPALIQHRRLVDAAHERQRVVDLVHPPSQIGVDAGQPRRQVGLAQLQRDAQLALGVIGLEPLLDVREAQLDVAQVLLVQLLRLDQHALAHADLAEVVQHARVLQLLQVRSA